MDLNYREWRPPPHLQDTIRCVWALWGDGSVAGGADPIVPDGCPEVVFNLADPFERVGPAGRHRQPLSMLVGPTTGPALVGPSGRCRIVGIRLQPWAGADVLATPMADLRDVYLPLDQVVGRWLHGLHERLAEREPTGWPVEVFRAFEGRPSRSARGAPLAGAVVGAIHGSRGALGVRALAQRFGTTERTVERTLREHVGLPPAVLSRIARFQWALGRLMSDPGLPLGRVALDAGYYDQAHFNRECRRLAGVAPSELVGGDPGLTEHFAG